jgi:hypothetical protein
MKPKEVREGSYIEQYERVLGHAAEREGEQFTFFCPFPECVDFPYRKFYVHPEWGSWFCQHCRYRLPDKEKAGGSWREFVRVMGDDPRLWPNTLGPSEEHNQLFRAEAIEVWNTFVGRLQLFQHHRQLVHARGIDPDRAHYVSAHEPTWRTLIREIGIEQAVRAGLAKVPEYGGQTGQVVPTLCCRPGRMLIPYWQEEQAVYFVGYAPRPPTWHSKWIKVANITGFPPPVYGTVPPGSPYAIVTEGQFKRDAAAQRGLPILGLPGMGTQHREVVAYLKKQEVPRMVILFDTEADPRTQRLVDQEALHLATEGLEEGLQVFRAQLPLLPEIAGGQKTDIDSFLLARGIHALVQAVQDAAHARYELEPDPERAATPAARRLDDIIATCEPPPIGARM